MISFLVKNAREQDALEAWHETLLIARFHDFENPYQVVAQPYICW
jgi:hypothetical protein